MAITGNSQIRSTEVHMAIKVWPYEPRVVLEFVTTYAIIADS